MPMSQEVERIFKLRQQYKQCHTRSERQSAFDSSNNKEENDKTSEISELIKKLKS